MPAWIREEDEPIWEKAKKAVDKSKYDNTTYWKIVMDTFFKMGGKRKK